MAYQFESVTIGKDGALVTLTCQEIEQDDIEGLETIRIALPLEVVAGGDAEAQATITGLNEKEQTSRSARARS